MTIPIDKSPSIKFQRHPLDEVCINTIRTLAIDAIQVANWDTPGRRWRWPRSVTTCGNTCFASILRTPSGPTGTGSCSWPATPRRRCTALLHLSGVRAVSKEYERLGEPSVPLEAIKSFRQWHSRCP